MMDDFVFRRRQLPHWDVADKPYFITGCLEGSISSAGLKRIREYREQLEIQPISKGLSKNEWQLRNDKLVFAFVDKLLDFQSPVKHLADPNQAKIVNDAFLHFAGKRYDLFAWCVMPSHHHWLFMPLEPWATEAVQEARKADRDCTPRELINQSIQSYTATMCNRVRGAKGQYWQHETFDHWVRSDDELLRIIQYIENNPVVAGLVAEPHQWQWSSASYRRLTKTPAGQPILPVG